MSNQASQCDAALLRCGLLIGFLALSFVPSIGSAQSDMRRWFENPRREVAIKDVDGEWFGDPWTLSSLPDGGFLVVDGGARLRAFDSDGLLRWSFGRKGGGPGEFRSIQDVAVTADGKVLVLDSQLSRMTLLDASTSELLGTIPLETDVPAGNILPVSQAVAMVRVGDSWRIVNEDGQVIHTVQLPVPCDRLSCEARTSANVQGMAVAFRWSSDLILLNPDGSLRAAVDGIEPQEFPELVTYGLDPEDLGLGQFATLAVTKVDPTALEMTRALALDGTRVFVLVHGASDNRGRIIDVYTMYDGAYQGSFLLPKKVSSIAILADGRLATLDVELFAQVTLWEVSP